MDGFLLRRGRVTLLGVISFFLFSCRDNSKRYHTAFKALDESLVSSNNIIGRSSDLIYESLKDKLSDPATYEKAGIWYPKAQLVRKLSMDIIDFLETLKREARKENHLQTIESGQLYERLEIYENKLKLVDSVMKAEFEESIVAAGYLTDSTQAPQKKELAKLVFINLPIEARPAILDKFENNIRIIENKLLLFCHGQTQRTTVGPCMTHYPIAVQNSTYVLPGEKMEITAGVAVFDWNLKPEVVVNNSKIKIQEDALAIAKFQAAPKPGKHFVPVKITFTNQDGIKQTFSKTLTYTVTEASIKDE